MELNTNDSNIIEIDVTYLGSKQRLVNHEEEGNLSCSLGVWENGRETISYYGLKAEERMCRKRCHANTSANSVQLGGNWNCCFETKCE